MARPTSKKQIPNLSEAIKETAWQQISENGAASLSLRAIARELNITAPAIYNYYARRDDLVTALIVDAFTSLGASQKEAIRNAPEDDFGARISTLGLAYRDWAVNNPQRYQLIFGTPIPKYQAPAEFTVPAATESLVPLIETLQACSRARKMRTEGLALLTPELSSMLEDWSQFTGGIGVEVLYTALVIWSRVHGLVSLELGHQFPLFIVDPGEIFRREIANLLIQYLKE